MIVINSELAFAFVGFFASLSSIIFAYLAFRRGDNHDQKEDGKSEGVMFANIGYIKECVDRVEKNLNKVEERYRAIAEKNAKLEESVSNLVKRVD